MVAGEESETLAESAFDVATVLLDKEIGSITEPWNNFIVYFFELFNYTQA